ncbi:MAG: cupredoxin domain-containing protein [Stellaceae bacterium]
MALNLKLRKADWIGSGLALTAFLSVVLALSMTHKLRAGQNDVANTPMVTVTQRNREYHPDRLTITRGTVLHIVNNDDFTHHVYVKSPAMNFDSGENPVGTSVNVEFDHPGTFDVQCAIHPTMHLWVTVK